MQRGLRRRRHFWIAGKCDAFARKDGLATSFVYSTGDQSAPTQGCL